MNILNNPIFATIAMAILAGVAIGIWFFVRKKKGKHRRAAKQSQTEIKVLDEYNCLVVDEKTRGFGLEIIPFADLEKIKGNNDKGIGRQWYYDKYEVYYLFRKDDGEYAPVEVPQTLKEPPSFLYGALQQFHTEKVYDMTVKEGIFAKYGPYLVVAGIAAFVIVATMQGG